MKLVSRDQVIAIQVIWSAACRVQGWNPKDRSKRMEVISRILDRPVESTKDIERNREYDRVKLELESLADKVASARPDAAELLAANRVAHHIAELINELGKFDPDPEGYVQTMCDGITSRRGEPSSRTWRDLDHRPRISAGGRERISELEWLRRTLNNRLNEIRRKAQEEQDKQFVETLDANTPF